MERLTRALSPQAYASDYSPTSSRMRAREDVILTGRGAVRARLGTQPYVTRFPANDRIIPGRIFRSLYFLPMVAVVYYLSA